MNKELNKIKVYHILTDKNIGGAGRWLLYYLKYCNRNRFDISVVLPKDSLLVSYIEALDIKTILVDTMEESSFDRNAIGVFKNIFLDGKPDVVHTHASFSARIGAKKAKVKLIINTKHCMEGKTSSKIKKIVKGAINKRYSNKIIGVSNSVCESMIAEGTDPKQVITVYNGIEKLRSMSYEEKMKVKANYGIDEKDYCVGIVARLEEVKDHETFIEAAQVILQKDRDFKFIVVGTGSLENTLKNKVLEYGMENKFVFTGFIEDISNIVGILDVNVITSKHEALCISLIEGMSIGIPCIGTDSGGVIEVIENEVSGDIINVGDFKALSEKIFELKNNNEKYKLYSRNSISKVKEKFDAKTMAEKIEEIYLNCLFMNK